MRTSRIISAFVGIVLIAALAGCGTSTTSAPAAATGVRTYVAGSSCFGNAIDKSGNVWVTNYGNGTPGAGSAESNVQEYMGAAKGPQYFPYSGPQWPGAE